jgi:hypothetical protein
MIPPINVIYTNTMVCSARVSGLYKWNQNKLIVATNLEPHDTSLASHLNIYTKKKILCYSIIPNFYSFWIGPFTRQTYCKMMARGKLDTPLMPHCKDSQTSVLLVVEMGDTTIRNQHHMHHGERGQECWWGIEDAVETWMLLEKLGKLLWWHTYISFYYRLTKLENQ